MLVPLTRMAAALSTVAVMSKHPDVTTKCVVDTKARPPFGQAVVWQKKGWIPKVAFFWGTTRSLLARIPAHCPEGPWQKYSPVPHASVPSMFGSVLMVEHTTAWLPLGAMPMASHLCATGKGAADATAA